MYHERTKMSEKMSFDEKDEEEKDEEEVDEIVTIVKCWWFLLTLE